MRKYWYYTFQTAKSFGFMACFSDSGEFDLAETTLWLKGYVSEDATITNWHEISSAQYKKLSKYFEKTNK